MRVLAALAAAGVLAGAAGASNSNPASFARSVTLKLVTGSPEAAWALLHPAQRRLVPRGQFAKCERISEAQGTFRPRVTVIGWQKVTIERREIPQHSGWSVRLLVRRTHRFVKDQQSRTIEVVRVTGKLRWLLDKVTFDSYRTADSTLFCP